MKKVYVLLGPTASGKTALSLSIAGKLNAEIVSADSRQVYRHIQVATCAPTDIELSRAKHYFVNELELDEEFNAGIFADRAKRVIADIFQREKNALVVGGSGLYIQYLVDGYFDEEVKDLSLRKSLNERLAAEGKEALYSELMSVDPKTALKMDAGKFRRVIRALEVYYATGKRISELHENNIKPDFESVQAGLFIERDILIKRINERVDGIIANGLIEEVKLLRDKGFSPATHNSLNTVGVKEVFQYLNNEISVDEMSELIKMNTRRYAKRQMTWFNADKRIQWLKVNDYENAELCSEQIMNIFK